jgi:hypothetical protein
MVASCGTLNHHAASPMIMNMRWPASIRYASLRQVVRESLAQLKAVATGTDPGPRGTR